MRMDILRWGGGFPGTQGPGGWGRADLALGSVASVSLCSGGPLGLGLASGWVLGVGAGEAVGQGWPLGAISCPYMAAWDKLLFITQPEVLGTRLGRTGSNAQG